MSAKATAVARSPLGHRDAVEAPDGVLRLTEVPFLTKLIVRGDASVIGPVLTAVTGLEMPAACRSAAGNDMRLTWLSPDEFLLTAAPDREAELTAALSDKLAGKHIQIVAVSDYYTVLELAGPKARQTLMALSTLDLHPRGFAAGDAAGTTFGHATGWLIQIAGDDAPGGPAFQIVVRWSHADYLFCELCHCGRGFGMPARKPVSGERLVI